MTTLNTTWYYKDMNDIILTNQAKWYLGGPFPVFEKPAVGYARVDPMAMQELVDKGLCEYRPSVAGLSAMWIRTEAGSRYATAHWPMRR